MSSQWDRLVDADPARAKAYAPKDAEAMMRRVLASRENPRRVWWALRARVGGAIALSATLTVGAVTLFSTAPSALEPLVFAATTTVPAASSSPANAPQAYGDATATATGVAPRTRYLTSALSDVAPSWVTYPITSPSDPRRALERVARALGLSLSGVSVSGSDASGQAGSIGLHVNVGPLDEWRLGDSPAAPPNVAQFQAHPTGLGTPLAMARALGAPAVSSSSAGVARTGIGSRVWVTIPIALDAHPTGLVDSFVFTQGGVLLGGSGYLVDVGSPLAYPLVSPRRAATSIARQAATLAGVLGPGRLGEPGFIRPTTTGVIRLSGSSLSYALLATSGGGAVAVPAYVFSAGASVPEAAALAIAPRYLRLPSTK